MAHDLSTEMDEVLACDDRVVAFTWAVRGTGKGGGPFEIALGEVVVVDNGVCVRSELYDPDDRHAMIARCTELTQAPAPLPAAD